MKQYHAHDDACRGLFERAPTDSWIVAKDRSQHYANWGPVCHTLKMKVQGHNVWKHKETSYRRQDPWRNEKFSGSYWLHIYGMVIPPIFPLATMTKQSKPWEARSFPSVPRLMSSQVSYAWLVCSLDHKGKEMWFDSQQLFEARNVAWWQKTACGRLYKKYYSVTVKYRK